jgi:hypothetical protein
LALFNLVFGSKSHDLPAFTRNNPEKLRHLAAAWPGMSQKNGLIRLEREARQIY